MIRDLVYISVLVGELVMLQAHILCCPYNETHTSAVSQRCSGITHYELDLASALSTSACELAGFPLVILAFGHLLDINREPAVAFGTTQVARECALGRYKEVTHSCELLACSYGKRQNIICIQQQVFEEVYLIGIYILR